jgi:hypothetical protein
METGGIVLYGAREREALHLHQEVTLVSVANALARLLGCAALGWHGEAHGACAGLYFVPVDTLLRRQAAALGIRAAADLFGGVVPWRFVRTKAITHDLTSATAARPDGWSPEFAAAVRDVVLPGYTAFTAADARAAVDRLLPGGPVRAKKPLAAGGRGQDIIASAPELDAVLDEMSDEDLAECGLVLETSLDDVTTLSIGQVVVGRLAVTYFGTQRLTSDNEGAPVYGGSSLTCVRGGWSALDDMRLPGDARVAAAQARVYDDAMRAYEDFMASRRNYDVARGRDASGRWWSGVLEQSWRVGGASPAEVAALEVLAGDPGVHVVQVDTVEAYGDDARPPDGATVHFHGVDPTCGPVLRYTGVTGRAPRSR